MDAGLELIHTMSIFHARWTTFALRKPRHPILRAACAVFGLFLLAGLLILGLVVGTLMLTFTLARRLLGGGHHASRANPASAGTVIEGNYSVVSDRSRILPH